MIKQLEVLSRNDTIMNLFLYEIFFLEGYYGLCYGSKLLNETDTCEMKKRVTITSNINFQFYYFMHGRQIGTLYLALDDNIVWSLSGSQEDEWLLAQVFISEGSYEVSFL